MANVYFKMMNNNIVKDYSQVVITNIQRESLNSVCKEKVNSIEVNK